MMTPELPSDTGYSPDIRMDLVMDGRTFQVAQICDGDITIRNARQMPSGVATIRLTVGGKLTIYEIQLPQGIDPARRKQSYRLLKTIEEAAA